MNIQKIITDYIKRLGRFLKQVKRVMKVATKPTSEEFWAVAKVTLIGMLIIGSIAYIIRSIDFLLA